MQVVILGDGRGVPARLGMYGHIVDQLATNVDPSPITKGLKVFGTGFHCMLLFGIVGYFVARE